MLDLPSFFVVVEGTGSVAGAVMAVVVGVEVEVEVEVEVGVVLVVAEGGSSVYWSEACRFFFFPMVRVRDV